MEPFGENVYREMSKMEFILQALTYPEIGKIIYTSSKAFSSTPGDPLADFRSAIAQGANVIVNFPTSATQLPAGVQGGDRGRESRSSTYAWGYVTGPGENYTTVVGEDTCALGEAFAQIMNERGGLREDRAPRRHAGQPAVRGWQECEREALNPEIEVVGTYDTNWVADRVQEAMASLLAATPTSRASATSTRAEWLSAPSRPSRRRASRSTRSGRCGPTSPILGCMADELNEPNLQIFYANAAGNWQIRTSLTAGMMQLKGFDAAAEDRVPDRVQGQLGGEPVRRGPTR